MKSLLCLGIFIAAVSAMDDPRKQATLMVMTACKTKVGATDDDIQLLLDKKLPTTHAGNCLLECLLTRGNMMKNGDFNKKGFLTSSLPQMKGDENKIKQLNKMVDECEKLIAAVPDKCDRSKEIVSCTSSKGKPFGFKFPSRL